MILLFHLLLPHFIFCYRMPRVRAKAKPKTAVQAKPTTAVRTRRSVSRPARFRTGQTEEEQRVQDLESQLEAAQAQLQELQQQADAKTSTDASDVESLAEQLDPEVEASVSATLAAQHTSQPPQQAVNPPPHPPLASHAQYPQPHPVLQHTPYPQQTPLQYHPVPPPQPIQGYQPYGLQQPSHPVQQWPLLQPPAQQMFPSVPHTNDAFQAAIVNASVGLDANFAGELPHSHFFALGSSVSATDRATILAGKYIELSKLRPQSALRKRKTVTVSMGEESQSLALEEDRPKDPETLDEWCKLFCTFGAILSSAPGFKDGPGLFTYMARIMAMAKAQPGLVWREYDTRFRLMKASCPSLPWHIISKEIKEDVVNELSTQPFPASAAASKGKQDRCHNFYTHGRCRYGKGCKHKHVCGICQSTNHSRKSCPSNKSANNNSNSNNYNNANKSSDTPKATTRK